MARTGEPMFALVIKHIIYYIMLGFKFYDMFRAKYAPENKVNCC